MILYILYIMYRSNYISVYLHCVSMKSLDRFFESYQQDTSKDGMYTSLAILYDYMYSMHYDYDTQKRIIKKNVDDVNSIIEGACGTGRLTHRLDKDYDYVVGFDLNKSMLDIGEKRYPHVSFRQGDLTDISASQNFDCYCVLGNSVVHLTEPQDFSQFASKAYSIVSDNGYLIFDCMDVTNMTNGYSSTDVFETKDYKVERNVITTKKSQYLYYMSFAFDILQKDSGDTIQTGDTFVSRTYDKDYLREKLQNAGFSSIKFKQYQSTDAEIDDILVLARP